MTRLALASVLLALATVVWPVPDSRAGWRDRWRGRPAAERRDARDRRSAMDRWGGEGALRPTPAGADPMGAGEVGSARSSDRERGRFRGLTSGRALSSRRSRRSRRAADRRTAEVLELLDALAPALRAGLPPAVALRAVAPPDDDDRSMLLVKLLDAADRADALAPVWRAEADELASADIGLVAAAWALCERLGSPLAPTVVTVSRVVRQRRAVRHRMEAALAGPRASMTVLTALPVAGPALALVMGLSPLELYATPSGAAALAAGTVLLGVGRLWGDRLVASVGVDGPAVGGRRSHGRRRDPGGSR